MARCGADRGPVADPAGPAQGLRGGMTMGDMADAIVNGECCQVCGEFFEVPTGYPTSCRACENEETP